MDEGVSMSMRVPMEGIEGGGRWMPQRERKFFSVNLLVQIHWTITMIWWTGLAPRGFEVPFPGSLTSSFLSRDEVCTIRPRGVRLQGLGSRV